MKEGEGSQERDSKTQEKKGGNGKIGGDFIWAVGGREVIQRKKGRRGK